MTPEFRKKKTVLEAPSNGLLPETGAPMDAHQGNLTSQLLRWDELTQDELSNLTSNRTSAAQLDHLQAAEQWLANAAPKPSTPCPSVEELYDLGGGPGAAPVDALRTSEFAQHLESCTDCRTLIETLKSAPPVPLDLQPEVAPLRVMPPVGRMKSRGPRRLLVPLAAAAAVLAIIGLWQNSNTPQGTEILAALPGGFPESPLLRGGADELAFPRGVVLERGAATLPVWASALSFELRPASEADSYRIEVREQIAGAFEAGTTIGVITGQGPTFTADTELLAALTPGRYTWEAWSLRDGLERRIGERGFEIREADSIWNTLTETLTVDGQLDSRAVRYLHELGLLTDAQGLALTLPSSSERDAYLATSLR